MAATGDGNDWRKKKKKYKEKVITSALTSSLSWQRHKFGVNNIGIQFNGHSYLPLAFIVIILNFMTYIDRIIIIIVVIILSFMTYIDRIIIIIVVVIIAIIIAVVVLASSSSSSCMRGILNPCKPPETDAY